MSSAAILSSRWACELDNLAEESVERQIVAARRDAGHRVLFRLARLVQARKASIAVDAFVQHAGRFVGAFCVVTAEGARVRTQD